MTWGDQGHTSEHEQYVNGKQPQIPLVDASDFKKAAREVSAAEQHAAVLRIGAHAIYRARQRPSCVRLANLHRTRVEHAFADVEYLGWFYQDAERIDGQWCLEDGKGGFYPFQIQLRVNPVNEPSSVRRHTSEASGPANG